VGGFWLLPTVASPSVLKVEVEGTPREVKPILRDEVYRIAGEALRTAFRHARAHRVEVTIRYDEQQLIVRVRDDGKGIGPETLEAKGRAGHGGLPGMRERASKIGAQLAAQLGAGRAPTRVPTPHTSFKLEAS